MRTDVKIGIALGLAVVLVAALFFWIPWHTPPTPAAPPQNVNTAEVTPESTATPPDADDLRLVASGYPPQDPAPAAPADGAPDPGSVAYDPYADYDAAPPVSPAAAAPDAGTSIPSDAAGFESTDPSSEVVIRPAAPAAQPPYGAYAPAGDPLSLPADVVPPSANTELVIDPADPTVAPAAADFGVYRVEPAAESFVRPAVAATYTVKANDSFWSIAAALWGDGTKYDRLQEANPLAKTLRPGQTLVVPTLADPAPAPVVEFVPTVTPQPAAAAEADTGDYTVQSGDSLWGIAKKLYGDGSRGDAIFEANRDRLKSKDNLRIGQKLRLPLLGSAPTAELVAIPAG